MLSENIITLHKSPDREVFSQYASLQQAEIVSELQCDFKRQGQIVTSVTKKVSVFIDDADDTGPYMRPNDEVLSIEVNDTILQKVDYKSFRLSRFLFEVFFRAPHLSYQILCYLIEICHIRMTMMLLCPKESMMTLGKFMFLNRTLTPKCTANQTKALEI